MSEAISNVAQRLSEHPDLIAEQMRINGERTAEMQRANARLSEKVVHLTRQVAFLRKCAGAFVGPIDGAAQLLRVELLAWLLTENRYLVLDDRDHAPPITLEPENEKDARRVASFLVALLCSEGMPDLDAIRKVLRPRCRKDFGGCGFADCSCGQSMGLAIPERVKKMFAEVGR